MHPVHIHVSRRSFIKAAAAAAGLPAWFYHESQAVAANAPKGLGPNDRPGIGLIGCGGQGTGDCNWAKNFGTVIAVADVDEQHAAAAKQRFKAEHQYSDFRRLLERDDVHVIINGTPDHWHTFVNVAAARAGKDIYSEKPLTLTIDEGKTLVKEIRRRKRILQVGSQQRSDGKFRLACELVRNGRIGKLQHIIVGLPTGPREGPFPKQPVPAGLNWDYYLGQTPWTDYKVKNCHGNFRWWYQFSGGQMTDWGAHHNDIAQWGNGTERSGPIEFEGKSMVDMIPGGYETASKYRVECRYENGVTMTLMDESTPHERGVVGEGKTTPNGVQFIGSNGWIYVSRGEIRANSTELLETPLPGDAVRLYKSDNHMGNFFECIRSRKDPICDVEIGHRSISVAHLGVISIRLGRKIRWNPKREEIVGDKEASQWLKRPMRAPYDWSFIA
ncbi:MAG: Gfo/Idh/MocA family oxidoreductase [Verrucomicrobiales bacterium]|nr:Gfo/Idh/MocA family oxidoreductase [Verrucomicrobiales bacterium]